VGNLVSSVFHCLPLFINQFFRPTAIAFDNQNTFREVGSIDSVQGVIAR